MHKLRSILYLKAVVLSVALYIFYIERPDMAFLVLLVYVLTDLLTMDKNKKP